MSWQELKKQKDREYSNEQEDATLSGWQRLKKKKMEEELLLNQKLSTNLPKASDLAQQILLPTAETTVSDTTKFGTFKNGYQPKGIEGHGSLSKTGQTINVDTGKKEYNKTLDMNTKVFNKQNIWQAEDGTKWVWDGKNKTYKPYEKTSNETGLMNDVNKQNILPIANQNIINNSIDALKQDEQRKNKNEIELIKTPEAFKDGYQFGDVTKTILGTPAYLGGKVLQGTENVLEGVNGLGKGLINTATAKILGIEPKALDILSNELESKNKFGSGIKAKEITNTTNKYSLVGKTLGEIAEGVGYSGTLGLAETLGGPVAMNLLTFSSATGNAYTEAMQKEEATNSQIWAKAIGSGSIETLTENLFGLFGKTGIDDKIANKLAKQASTGIGKALTRTGIMMGSEASEEAISAVLNHWLDLGIDAVSNGKGAKFAEDIDWEQVAHEAFLAASSAGLMGAGSTAIGINQTARDNNVNMKESLNIYENNLDRQAELEKEKSQIEKTIKKEQKNGNDTAELQKQLRQINNLLGVEQNSKQGNINQASQSNINDLNNQGQQSIQENVNQAQNQVQDQIEQKEEKIQENYKKILNEAKYIPQNEKNELIKSVNSETSLDDFKNFVNKMNNNYKVEEDKILNKTFDKEAYKKYINDNYDNIAIEKAKEIIPANKQGRRTKEQWLNVAKQIGVEISDKSNSEIEKIAYKSWQEEAPNQKEQLNRQGQGFVKFTADEWLNAIYDSVKNTRNNIKESIDFDDEKDYNDVKIGEEKNVSIKSLLPFLKEGGYRTDEQINSLKNSIKQNGITEPIELVKKNDGTIEIENGNHRLQIANELGIKEIPVKFTESWENIGVKPDVSERKSVEEWRNYYDGSNENIKRNNEINGSSGNIEGRRRSSSNKFENRETAETNVKLSTREFDINNKQTIDTEIERNIGKIKNSEKGSFNLSKKEEINNDDKKKQRKHYKSIIQSSNMSEEARKIAKELMGIDTYEPDSNKRQLKRADERLMRNTPDNELIAFTTKLNNGDKIKADDIAVGERLIQYYSKIGDAQKLQTAIQNTALAGTELGQAVQAMSILNHQTPAGQVSWIQRSVDKMNNNIAKKKNWTIERNENGLIEKVTDKRRKRYYFKS